MLAIALSAWAHLQAASAAVDYGRDVRPILSENCFACHGFDEAARQGDLRLDQAESATADRGGYAAIVPGDPAASAVWQRITSSDEAEIMPPLDSHRELTASQKEIIRRWIAQGAGYSEHWSFIPAVKAPLPEVVDGAWPRNEIDRFVLARLEAEGLNPSPEADRRTLIRRLSLDLLGLPPSAEEAEAFVADSRADAYEQLVERLLASPHFGERMALAWLDAARYADTNGFSIDGGRHMWLWRDWVIDAFNRNLPYDQFLIDQLAGDLLPDRTEAQLVASGFQRNNMVTHEGGTIAEENLTNYNADRVKTLGEAVLGLTLGCAQCHDHKYDPVTQRDYYRLFAYFNSVSDIGLDGNGGVNPRPYVAAKTVLSDAELPSLRSRIEAIKQELEHPPEGSVEAWISAESQLLGQRGRELQLHPTKLLNISTPNAGAGFEIEDDRYVKIAGAGDLVAYDVSLELPQVGQPITGIRIVFHPTPEAPGGGWGYGTLPVEGNRSGSVGLVGNAEAGPAVEAAAGPTDGAAAGPTDKPKGTFVVTSFSASAEAVPGDQVNLNLLRAVGQVTANSWREDYRPENVLDTRGINGWSPQTADQGPVHITVTFADPIDAAETPYLTAQVNFGQGGPLVAARFEFEALTGVDDGSTLPPDVISLVQSPDGERTDQQRQRLIDYFAWHAPEYAALRVELANLGERVRALTERFPTMVMDVAEKPRETHILERGNYAAPKELVTAGTPEFLPPPPEGAPPNRLGLAQWITAPVHPLTARVAVNRVWQLLFGAGIVRTPADFGRQGEWPTHPALLDWLAVDFIEHGWDVKRLVRSIVTSAAYRQSSAASEDMLAGDPDNRLLARGPRFRLPAEFIRDAALKTSGLWVERIGGPSVNPYSPGDLWREISHYGSTPATAQTFVQDHGEKLYRRSLYTYWKRTVPPPNMAAFDAPNRETCVVQRPSTITPLQALVLLNDVQFVEASRAFAERVLKHEDDDRMRLTWAFEECLSRPPGDEELLVLIDALERERTRYANDESAARRYLANGESPRDASLPVAEHAAWSQIAALLLNLSETVTCN
ncbi:MAG: PSD1 domain-containing protein [Pirellulales bacterium]|nr:PSD1 domain-containing protein [Pirellulales bacterium]